MTKPRDEPEVQAHAVVERVFALLEGVPRERSAARGSAAVPMGPEWSAVAAWLGRKVQPEAERRCKRQ